MDLFCPKVYLLPHAYSIIPPMAHTQNRQHITIFAIVFMDLFGFGIVLPLLPYIAERFAATPLQVGLLAATYSLFQFIAGPILGRLSDRYGRRKLLIISQLGSVAGYVLLALANSLPLLFLARMIDGITGGNISIAQAVMADLTDKQTRAKGMGLLGAAFGLGFMLGPTLGGILSRYGFATPALFAAAVGLLTTVLTYLFLSETVNVRHAAHSPRTALTWQQILAVLRTHPIGLLIITFFLLSLGFSGMQGTYALWAQSTYGWGPQQVGYLFGYIGILSILIQTQVLPRLIHRFGERQLLLVNFPLLALGFLLLSLSPALPLHLLANFFIVLGNSLGNPTLTALATENIPPDEYGETLGLLQSAGSLGRIIGPAAAGEIYTLYSPHTPFRLSALIFLATGYYLFRNLKGQSR